MPSRGAHRLLAMAKRSRNASVPNVAAMQSTASHRPLRSLRAAYLAALGWAVTLLGAVRLVSYLPTLWAIHASGDSSQHALATWLTWAAANAAMAAWLYEQHGRRADCTVVIHACNTVMCLLTVALITAYRF